MWVVKSDYMGIISADLTFPALPESSGVGDSENKQVPCGRRPASHVCHVPACLIAPSLLPIFGGLSRCISKTNQTKMSLFFFPDTKGIMMMWWLHQGLEWKNTLTPRWESLCQCASLALCPEIANNWSAGADHLARQVKLWGCFVPLLIKPTVL